MRNWFRSSPSVIPRIGTRRPAHGFTALASSGTFVKQHEIRDISATGIYLVTTERWPQGSQIQLTLHRTNAAAAHNKWQITMEARTVRWGEDGVGLAFVLPKDIDTRQWVGLVEIGVNETAPDDLVSPFKFARSFTFLNQICAPAGSTVCNAIREGLSNHRQENAIEITLRAEEIARSWPDRQSLRGNPGLIVRILQDGSWADDELVQQCWAGLLATACCGETKPDAHLQLVQLFSQLTAIHVRVFTAACTQATKIVSDAGLVSAQHLHCTAEEIMRFSGSPDPQRIDRDLEHISELGLLEKRIKSSFFMRDDEINVTPTTLGLELFAGCHGMRGGPRELCCAALVNEPAIAS